MVTLFFLRSLCAYVRVNILTLSPPRGLLLRNLAINSISKVSVYIYYPISSPCRCYTVFYQQSVRRVGGEQVGTSRHPGCIINNVLTSLLCLFLAYTEPHCSVRWTKYFIRFLRSWIIYKIVTEWLESFHDELAEGKIQYQKCDCKDPCLHWLTHPFMYINLHLIIHPSTYLPTHPSIQPPIQPPTHLLSHQPIHPATYSSIHPTTHPHIHPPTHPPICVTNYTIMIHKKRIHSTVPLLPQNHHDSLQHHKRSTCISSSIKFNINHL